ncbi:MAG: dihydrodipicolinate synthase family protein [Alphaproteobacteria bacterium]|nr:dihydrodipicolinate synthase family protein [Alphaproteobacteria bacterium]
MTIARIRAALGGVSGVHVTPYAADGSVDTAMLARVVKRIATAGVHNIVSCGNTGEYYALEPGEVERVQHAAIEANAGHAVLTVAVGRSRGEAIAATRTMARAGAHAAMVHHPVDPFAAPHAQAAYFEAIAEASPIPVVAYVRSDAIGVNDLVRLAAHPNLAGLKFATTNLMLLAACLREASHAAAVWVCGLAEGWAAPFYALGARGFTSGLVNVWPERSLAIHEALEAGHYPVARRLVDGIAGFEQLRARHGNGANVTVVKEAMGMLGMKVGPVRHPGADILDPADRERLAAIVAGWNISRTARAVAE